MHAVEVASRWTGRTAIPSRRRPRTRSLGLHECGANQQACGHRGV